MSKFFLISMIQLLLVGCVTSKQNPSNNGLDYAKADQGLINLLIQKGSNPNKAHSIDFFVECKSKQIVSDIVSKAVLFGFEDDYIHYSEKDGYWSTSLSSELKLNLADISEQRHKLMPLVTSASCKKITWGASVVK